MARKHRLYKSDDAALKNAVYKAGDVTRAIFGKNDIREIKIMDDALPIDVDGGVSVEYNAYYKIKGHKWSTIWVTVQAKDIDNAR